MILFPVLLPAIITAVPRHPPRGPATQDRVAANYPPTASRRFAVPAAA